MKSYLDYGIPTPIQVGAIEASRGAQACVARHAAIYQGQRDGMVDELGAAGRGQSLIDKPPATMFVWARIPRSQRHLDSLAFSKRLLGEGGVRCRRAAASAGVAKGFVRYSLAENVQRIRQAVRNIRRLLERAATGTAESRRTGLAAET